MTSDAILQFVHIPKTGGAAMNRLLRRVYGDAYFRDHPRYGHDVHDLPADAAVKCLSSHRPRGYERSAPIADRLFLPFTIVRHPVDRLVSLYNFTTHNEQHHWYETVRDMSPDEFFELLPDRPRDPSVPFTEVDWAELADAQARSVVGGTGPLTERTMIDVVSTEYLAIAPVERHGLLTQALADELSWPDAHRRAERFNESRQRINPNELNSQLRSRIEKVNSLDLALYRFAQRLASPMLNRTSTLARRFDASSR